MASRPLCMGRIGDDVLFASESCALDAIGATFVRDIEAGEVVVVNEEGIHSYKMPGACHDGMCIFEFIYFARPDSVIDGSSVHEARIRAGSFLALDHPVQADVVIGVPDSGLDAAIGYSRTSGIPYGIGFIKNKYIGRTFIQPGQKQRQDAVRIKLNAISATVKGKRVVMVDDSIVRGTTCARIVRLLREAGATEDACTPVRPAVHRPLLLRHGRGQQGEPDCRTPFGGRNRQNHRCGLHRLFVLGGVRQAGGGQPLRILQGLLLRQISG